MFIWEITTIKSRQILTKMIASTQFSQFIDTLDVPILDIGDKRGYTDYIDFIEITDVSAPVMKGIDCFSRPFLVLKMKGKSDRGDEIDLFQTFFQRYTGDIGLWMGAGSSNHELFNTCGGMNSKHFTAIKEIIEGKTVDISWSYRNSREKISYVWLSS